MSVGYGAGTCRATFRFSASGSFVFIVVALVGAAMDEVSSILIKLHGINELELKTAFMTPKLL